MTRKVALALLILISYLLQVTLLKTIAIGNISPNLLLILTASFGLMRGKKEGLWIGFGAGLLSDIFSGTLYGLNALIYMYTGYIAGVFSDSFYHEDIKIPIFLISISDLVHGIMTYGFTYLLRGRLDVSFYFRRIILPEVIYTILFTIFTYRLFKWIKYHLEGNEHKGVKSVV